jgi:hypothetical protein
MFTCMICGAHFDSNPRVERLLKGDAGFQILGNQCWVCARLTISLDFEARNLSREIQQACEGTL